MILLSACRLTLPLCPLPLISLRMSSPLELPVSLSCRLFITKMDLRVSAVALPHSPIRLILIICRTAACWLHRSSLYAAHH